MNLRRILMVTEPGQYGVLEYVRTLTSYLFKNHLSLIIDLAYSSRRGSSELDDFVKVIESHQGRSIDLEVENAPEINDFIALKKIISLIRATKPDIIHAHSSKAGALCRLLKIFFPATPPLVYTPNAYFGMGGSKNLSANFFNLIEGTLGRIGSTINCSSDERNFALGTLRLPPRKLVLIYHGIDRNVFRPALPEEKIQLRKELNLPLTGKLLITIGRYSAQKNYPPLYAALENLMGRTGSDLIFLHAGHGSEELADKLSDEVRTRVHTFKWISDMAKFLRAADGFVLTSCYEGLSLAMLAALACGLKMFLTKVPGTRCLERLKFTDIHWFELHAQQKGLEKNILDGLQQWEKNLLPFSSNNQVALVQKCFDIETQFSKTYSLYKHLCR